MQNRNTPRFKTVKIHYSYTLTVTDLAGNQASMMGAYEVQYRNLVYLGLVPNKNNKPDVPPLQVSNPSGAALYQPAPTEAPTEALSEAILIPTEEPAPAEPAPILEVRSNVFEGASAKSAFTAGNQTTTTTPISNANILWGGAAIALLGATLAEWQRKRAEEEAARLAALRNSGGGDEGGDGGGRTNAGRKAYQAMMQEKRIVGALQAEQNAKAQAAIAKAAQADMTQEEKLSAYKQTAGYIARQESNAEYERQKAMEAQRAGERNAVSIVEEYKKQEQAKQNAVGGKPLALPVPQEPNPPDKYNDGVSTIWDVFDGDWWKSNEPWFWPFGPWWDSSTMPTTPINLTATAAIQSAQTQVYATQTAQAPTLTPTATSIPHNYMGIYTASIAQEMLAKQNQGALVLPEYFFRYSASDGNTHCTEYVSEIQRIAGIPIQGVSEPVNPVSFRTPINQRYNSELNGEIRFRLNPNTHASTLMSSDPQTVIEEIQKIYASNPNMFVPGATIYTKAPDFFMVDNGDSYLNDYGGAFGHAAMLVELGSNGPIIHEMSGPNSYIQSNGVYPGTWGNWTYRWEPIKDLEYKIIPRGLFDTVPISTIVTGNPAGSTTATVILTELSIVPAQPILPSQLQNYGLNFELSQSNQVAFKELVSQDPIETVDKKCFVDPDTANNNVQLLYCPPAGTP